MFYKTGKKSVSKKGTCFFVMLQRYRVNLQVLLDSSRVSVKCVYWLLYF